MTYGRGPLPGHKQSLEGATVSHLAELVRGNFLDRERKAPSSAHRVGGASSTRRAPSPQGILLRNEVEDNVGCRFGERGGAWASR